MSRQQTMTGRKDQSFEGQSPPGSISRPPYASLLTLAIYTLLSIGLTWPLIFNLTSAVPNDIGDPVLNTWILAWDSHALLTNATNLFNANIFYPLPNTLAYSEHLFSTALFTLPIQLLAGEPVLAYNLSLLVTFSLSGFGMYLFTRCWTRQRDAAFIAGLIFAFTPYRFAAIAHLQLLTFQWLPFILLFVDKLIISPATKTRNQDVETARSPIPWSLALGVFLLLQILASWYLALYTALIVGIYLLASVFAGRINRSGLLPLFLVFLVSALLTLPFVLPYISLVDDLRQARPLSLALSLAATPTDFAAAAPFNIMFGQLTEPFRTRPNFTEENVLFIGVIGPVLAIVALVSSLRHSILRLASQITYHASRSKSSKLTPANPQVLALFLTLILSLALTFRAPYALLATIFPSSTVIRVPPRWIIPGLFALSGLAGFGYTSVRNQIIVLNSKLLIFNNKSIIQNFLFLIVTFFLVAEAFSLPLPLASVENRHTLSPAYQWLADQPNDFALIELPLHSAPAPEFPEVKRLYASTVGWWPLVNGYSGYTPPRQTQLAEVLAAFPDAVSIRALQTLASTTRTGGAVDASNLFVLIHPGEAPFNRSQWETEDRWEAERNPALRPLGVFEGDYLYQVRSADPDRFSAPPLATFGSESDIRFLVVEIGKGPTNGEQHITLYWQAKVPLATDYTVFIHLRAPDGLIRSQADGPPVSGHYPTVAWQPGEIIQDLHALPTDDLSQIDHLAIGLYDPAAGERLPVYGPDGRRLIDDALLVPLH